MRCKKTVAKAPLRACSARSGAYDIGFGQVLEDAAATLAEQGGYRIVRAVMTHRRLDDNRERAASRQPLLGREHLARAADHDGDHRQVAANRGRERSALEPPESGLGAER